MNDQTQPSLAETKLAGVLLAALEAGTFEPSWTDPDYVVGPYLEWFLPELLGRTYDEWSGLPGESLDGVYIASAVVLGVRRIQLLGTCILITDQTVTPFQAVLEVSESGDSIERYRIRLGERGGGRLGISGPGCTTTAADRLLHQLSDRVRLNRVDWVYVTSSSGRSCVATADLTAVRSAWCPVFRANDPFSWPFQETVECARVFYPTCGYALTSDQYSALIGATLSTDGAGFLMSLVESEGLSFLDRDWGHWSCDLPTYEEYSELCPYLETALYSQDGRWGVLISHEDHALIGGSKAFVAALDDHYGECEDDLRMLREAWSGNPNRGSLESTLSLVIRRW